MRLNTLGATIVAVLGLCTVVAGIVWLCACPKLRMDLGPHVGALGRLQNSLLVKAVFSEPIPFCIPEGNVWNLERWLEANMSEEDWAICGFQRLVHREDGHLILRDAWGRRLVYQYPMEGNDILIRLYSIGPNGKDDHGQSDDVDASLPFTIFTSMDEHGYDKKMFNLHRAEMRYYDKGDKMYVGIQPFDSNLDVHHK